MSDMKCPVCNVLLDECGDLLYCPNDHCSWGGNKELWQALIDTKKILDIAMDGLKRIEKLTEPSYKNRNLEALALAVNTFSGEIIEQITALEQKDK